MAQLEQHYAEAVRLNDRLRRVFTPVGLPALLHRGH
jgi:hypothetical protein